MNPTLPSPNATPSPAAPAPGPLTPARAWLVGGGLAAVALGSLAAALLLKAPAGTVPQEAEPRETIVSTLSPTPRVAAAEPRRGERAAPAAAPAGCADCAVVQAVTAIGRRGEATGLGAVGGGVAGHAFEKKARSTTEYRVRVALADGSTRTLSHPTTLAVGERVRVRGERLWPLSAAAAAATRTAPARRTAAGDEPPERPRSMADAKRL